ncbi:hypothetical protein A2625_01680 [candidate division WOR-1 bacterium RIFCSPHIGHO2_01_FULL_53_15]|uniref:Polymerase beta nucleotidyltransferase domain-containing protein n=1 Tax=candidate division WOR-1 bacterium RIFCSPHIGHO2_01_FULL_53_15 TaxID=1802564 RepID=A0A1F4Q2D3_UNCSA|nr:MAG: hypothetical protein A2625_01680 [candidate division WOR-1 bacterium RIFCSPHIGHO2_01_FULL_53_15]OGC13639.1 MAG: hypothetical protein A3D23_06325 [candidate division WOR-1 bacterium RIFCSPHIGHO2_02_FULL_53_26]
MIPREEVVSKIKKYFEENAGKNAVELAFLYGSSARGQAKEKSDVDIAIVLKSDFDSDDKVFDLIAGITVELSALLGREVEIIPIRKDFGKPALYYNAIVLGRPVFIGNKNRYIQIYNQALFEMNDFELFGLGWQFKASGAILGRLSHG